LSKYKKNTILHVPIDYMTA